MAGIAKSVYLSVMEKGQHRAVFRRVFFNARDYRDYVLSEEFMAQWPEQLYDIVKETY